MPPIVELNDQDYMVPLQAFVTYATAFATPRDPFHRYSVLVGTNAAVGSHPLVGLTVLVALWMDDFDANTALSKSNCTSVFAAVATVLLVDPAGSILRGFLSDVLGDCSGHHYCGVLGQCVPLRVYLLHFVCDQPTKRALCGLKAGNGKYHACFGYSIGFSTLRKPFPACAACRAILVDNNDDLPTCPHCHAWTLPTLDQHLLYGMPLIPELQTSLQVLRESRVLGLSGVQRYAPLKEILAAHLVAPMFIPATRSAREKVIPSFNEFLRTALLDERTNASVVRP
jgi:hypothetical protein